MHTAPAGDDRLAQVLAAIDAANAQDPNSIEVEGQPRPAELVYGERMSAALQGLYPEAGEALTIAARAQHIQRWIIPRADYPMDRAGYLRWRNALKARHAELAGEIMGRCGYGPEPIERVGVLLRKQGLKRDAEVQALEDVACLVFLEHYLAGFAAKHEDAKLISILAKTWTKMSDRAHEAALQLDLPPRLSGLMEAALEGGTN